MNADALSHIKVHTNESFWDQLDSFLVLNKTMIFSTKLSPAAELAHIFLLLVCFDYLWSVTLSTVQWIKNDKSYYIFLPLTLTLI